MQAEPGRPPRVPRGAVLAGALAVGVAGDLLLHSSRGPGLNLLLLFGVLALVVVLVNRRAGVKPDLEAGAWMAAGLLFAMAFLFRAAPALQLLAFLAASAAFAFPALRAGRGWLAGSGVSDHLEAIGAAILHSGVGPLRLLAQGSPGGAGVSGGGPAPEEAPAHDRHASPRMGWGILRGIFLAVPLLLLFGALFMSADRVFAGIVTELFRIVDPGEVASHLVFMGLLTWLASGYLSGFVTGTRLRGWIQPVLPRPSIGIVETGTVLGLVGLLFAAFVLVQFRYLFGGSSLVEVTPGLTYAEYAREGFAQLVVAAALVLPCLLAADWLLRRDRPRDTRVFQGLGGVQLLLLLVVIASALQRVLVYQAAYGLTELRLYGAAFLLWLTLLSLWFAATVLRGRREHFASVAVVSAFALVAALLVMDPDARIAGTNLARDGEFDAAYLGSLSADAAPTLLAALPALPLDARCTLAGALHRRWALEERGDWRSWNRSEARARRLLAEAPAGLFSTSGCPDPVEGDPWAGEAPR